MTLNGNSNGWGQMESRLGQMRSNLQFNPTIRNRSFCRASSASEEEFQGAPLAKRNAPKKFNAKVRTDNRFRKPPIEEEYVSVSTIRKDMNYNILPKRQQDNERGRNKKHQPPSKTSRSSRKPKEKGNEDMDVVKETKSRANWRNYPKPWLHGISKFQTVIKAGRDPEIGIYRRQILHQLPPPPEFIPYDDFPSNNPVTLEPKTSVQMMIQSYEQKKGNDELSYDGVMKSRFDTEGRRVHNLDLKQRSSSLSFLANTPPVRGDFDAILDQRMEQNPYSNALYYHEQSTAPRSTANTQETFSPRYQTEYEYETEYETELPRYGITMTSDGRTGSDSELGSARKAPIRISQRRSPNRRVHFDTSPSPSFGQNNQRGSTYRLLTQGQNENSFSTRGMTPKGEFMRSLPQVETPLHFLFTPTSQPQASYSSKTSIDSGTLPLYHLNYFPRPIEQIPHQQQRPSNTFLEGSDQIRKRYSNLLPPSGSYHRVIQQERIPQSMYNSGEQFPSHNQSQAFIPGGYDGSAYPAIYSPSPLRQRNQLDARMLLQAQSNQFFNGPNLHQERSRQFAERESIPSGFPHPPGPAYYASSSQLSSAVPNAPPPTTEKMMPSPLIHMEQRPSWAHGIPLNAEGVGNGQVNQLRQHPVPVFHQTPTDLNRNICGPPSVQLIPIPTTRITPSPGMNHQSRNSLEFYKRNYVEKHGFESQLVRLQEGESVHLQNPNARVGTESSRGRPKLKKSGDGNSKYKKTTKIPRNVPAVSNCGTGGSRRSESVPATPCASIPLCFRDFKSSVEIHDELKMLEKLRQNMNTGRSISADSSCASVRVLLSSCMVPNVPKKKVSTRLLANAKDYGHKFCPCYECRRANGLYVNEGLAATCLDQIDYVRKNIQDLKKYKKTAPNLPTVFVDTPKGDKNPPLVQFAGRKGYGKIPGYLFKRKLEIEHTQAIKKEEERKLAEEKVLVEIERQKQEEYRRLFHQMERRRAAAKANFCLFKTDLESDPKWNALESTTDSNYNCFLYMNGKVQSELLKMKGEGAPVLRKMPGNEENKNSVAKINMDALKPQKKMESDVNPEVMESKPRNVFPTPCLIKSTKIDNHQQFLKNRNTILVKTYAPKVFPVRRPVPGKKFVKKQVPYQEGPSLKGALLDNLGKNMDTEEVPPKTFGPEMSDGDIFDDLNQVSSYRRNISSAPGRILHPLINPHLVRVHSNYVFPELRYRLHPVNSTPNLEPMRDRDSLFNFRRFM